MGESYFDVLTSEGTIPAETFDPVLELKRLRRGLMLRLQSGRETPDLPADLALLERQNRLPAEQRANQIAHLRQVLSSLRLSYGKYSRRYRLHTLKRAVFRKKRYTDETPAANYREEIRLLRAVSGISFVSLGLAGLVFIGSFFVHNSSAATVCITAGLAAAAAGFGGRFLAENGNEPYGIHRS
ncbi:MAG: hypothetical protein LBH00_02000 [Planctomycetaceae bacterium]|jgi:hypothetical protein|nr:hypothetical protein [Planctomycetaceae bacterium]